MFLLCTALLAEAKPLIDFFHLKLVHKESFQIWENDFFRLAITGTGKVLSAAGCSFLCAKTSFPCAFVNIGIAGHFSLSVGTPFLAHKIIELGTQKTFYPTFLGKTPCITEELFCVDLPEKNFSSPGGYDMESFGFFSAAEKFLPFELIHSFKIVSDNPKNTFHTLNEKDVSKLIQQNLLPLNEFLEFLKPFAKKFQTGFFQKKRDLTPYLQTYHFSETQTYQLQELLCRLETLDPTFSRTSVLKGKNGKDVLQKLAEKLKHTPLVL